MKSKIISLLYVLVNILVIDLIVTIGLAIHHGVYSGTETEFSSIIENMSVEDCPPATTNGKPWLYSKFSTFDRSIFPCLVEKMLFDYHFTGGKFIPRKYSHLVDEKISKECGCKWSSKIF